MEIRARFLVVFLLLFFFFVHLSSSTHSNGSDSGGGVGGTIVGQGKVEVEQGKDDCTESETEVDPSFHEIQPAGDVDGWSKPNISLGLGTDYDDKQPKRRKREQKCKKTVKTKCKKLQRNNIRRPNAAKMKGKKPGRASQKRERKSKRLERKGKRKGAGRTNKKFGNRYCNNATIRRINIRLEIKLFHSESSISSQTMVLPLEMY